MSHHRDSRSDGSPGSDADTITHVRGEDEPPSYSVVVTVAAVTGADPETLRPLCETIDPDALNRVIGSATDRTASPSSVRVAFEFAGCGVTLYGDSRTVISIPDEDA